MQVPLFSSQKGAPPQKDALPIWYDAPHQPPLGVHTACFPCSHHNALWGHRFIFSAASFRERLPQENPLPPGVFLGSAREKTWRSSFKNGKGKLKAKRLHQPLAYARPSGRSRFTPILTLPHPSRSDILFQRRSIQPARDFRLLPSPCLSPIAGDLIEFFNPTTERE